MGGQAHSSQTVPDIAERYAGSSHEVDFHEEAVLNSNSSVSLEANDIGRFYTYIK